MTEGVGLNIIDKIHVNEMSQDKSKIALTYHLFFPLSSNLLIKYYDTPKSLFLLKPRHQ